MQGRSDRIVVAGAGIVGVSTAIWLQRAGFQVTLIDQDGPAAGTSYGNAGILASASIVPVLTPGMWKKIPSMLLDPREPLFLKWRHFPRLVPFLVPFLRNAADGKVRKTALALTELLHDSADQHLALARGTPAENYLHPGDYVYGYENEAAFQADAYAWKLRKQNGFEFEEMDRAEFEAYDLVAGSRFGYGVRHRDHGHVSDPGEYIRALADHFVAGGGELLIARITGITKENGRATAVRTEEAEVDADHVVLAMGVWSRELAKSLGLKVPLEAERGYHVEFVNPNLMPRSPVMVSSGKFVMTPMKGRLRCAGIAEFAGINTPPSQAPFDLLKRKMRELMPELEYERIDEWMGIRPSTTDSLPMIGAANACPNVWTGFGHQHVGLTGGPKTGRWLAQLIAGKRPNVDLTPFDANRFN